MDKEPPSWIDNPAFQWTPEVPLPVEPQTRPALPADAPEGEPAPQPRPEISAPAEPAANPAPAFPSPLIQEHRATPAVHRAPGLFLPRLTVGLGQGACLSLLFAWPGVNRFAFSAAVMVLVFAPLVLLAGLGRMRLRPLLAWTALAGAMLAGAGWYHRWRTDVAADAAAGPHHPGLALLVLSGLFLFIGQSIAMAQPGNYPAHYRAAWRLAIRILLCALLVGLAWAALGALEGVARARETGLNIGALVTPLVALSAAIAAQLTDERLLGVLEEGLAIFFTLALPFVLLAAASVAGLGALSAWQPSALLCAVIAATAIVCINASYRDGTSWRPFWRRRGEFVMALLITPLALLACVALAARVAQYGWTTQRIFAAAALLLLMGYALCYAAAALISLGGGGWMQRIETGNLAMAFAAMTLIAALASPAADPARLAVAAQGFRLEQGRIAADAFDFNWLRDGGERFGHTALTRMAAMRGAPAIARGAYDALAVPVTTPRPTPTEIGANIRTHWGNARSGLPAGLLARDWSGVAGAPPCLTSAAPACDAFFADLDGDGRDEILLVYGDDARWWGGLMKQGQGGGWYVAGTLAAPPCPGSLAALRAGHFSVVRPVRDWRDLLVNGIRLSVDPARLDGGCPKA